MKRRRDLVTATAEERRWAADGIVAGARRTLREAGDIRLALGIGLFLLLVPRRLEQVPLEKLLSEIDRADTVPSRSPVMGIERITRLRQAWLASPLLSGRNTCYMRALTLYRFLDPAGRTKRVHFGVEPGVAANDRLRGHAWVTLDGELLEAPEPVIAGRVRELYVYPPDA